jgi:hypothetical protein
MIDLALSLRILCPLNCECDPAIGAELSTRILLPSGQPMPVLIRPSLFSLNRCNSFRDYEW